MYIGVGSPGLTALNLPGTGQNITTDGTNTIKFGWLSSWTGELSGSTSSAVGPPSAYPLTVIYKGYPLLYGASNSQYYTGFFWGNRGTFTWSSGAGKCYYGAHPFPRNGGPLTTDQFWELAVDGSDLSNSQAAGNQVAEQWNEVVTRVRHASSQYQHEVYFDYGRLGLTGEMHYNADNTYGATAPPTPCLCFCDAPWSFINRTGTFADPDTGEGAEIWKGYQRGYQIYTLDLSNTQLAAVTGLETDDAVKAAWAGVGLSQADCFYLCMNPTHTDITDKSGNGNHPGWFGSQRPTTFNL